MPSEACKRALILAEEGYAEAAEGLTGLLRQLWGNGFETTALCPGWQGPLPLGVFNHCLTAPLPGAGLYDSAYLAALMADLHQKENYDAILFLATPAGRLAAPRLAMRLGAGLVADVTEAADGLLIRPAFKGKLFAAIRCEGNGPLMTSVRPGAFETPAGYPRQDTRVESLSPPPAETPALRLLSATQRPAPTDIKKSHLLVAGGGGVADYFPKVEALARALGGMAASSRWLVDRGITRRAIQVGHSGKTVKPKLYIAIGIFGSIQHVEGIKDVPHILAVNQDANAPICSLAELVVEGDGETFIDMLLEKLAAERENCPNTQQKT